MDLDVSTLNLYSFDWKCLIVTINLSNRINLKAIRETIRLFLRELIYIDFKMEDDFEMDFWG